MTYPIKFFNSEMENAPQITNAFGCITTLLDACLINGFNTKTVDSITWTGGVATLTIAAGHGFIADQIILITGCNETEYNGEQRVVIAGPTTLTFNVSGSPASPATTSTSITVMTAPIGSWSIAFTGTQKRAYRTTDPASINKPIIYVDDSQDPLYNAAYAKKAKVMICQDMWDISTPKGQIAPFDQLFPKKGYTTSGSGASVIDGWYKWYYAKAESTTAISDISTIATLNRKWVLIGDSRGFYFFTEHNGTYGKAFYGFTEFNSYKVNDGYNSFLMATDFYQLASYAPTGHYPYTLNNGLYSVDGTGKVILRQYHQTGTTTPIGAFIPLNTSNTQTISGYSTGVPWPNGPDFGLFLHPVYLYEGGTVNIRGTMPGVLWVHNNSSPLTDQTIVSNVTGFPDKKILLVAGSVDTTNGNAGRIAFDITGPWW